jgi:hypothetical protein
LGSARYASNQQTGNWFRYILEGILAVVESASIKRVSEVNRTLTISFDFALQSNLHLARNTIFHRSNKAYVYLVI